MVSQSKKASFKCKKCGRCCVLARCIYVGSEEVKSLLYKTRKAFSKDKKGKKIGATKSILSRKKVFILALGKEVTVCYAFDEKKNLCSIYDHRPAACKQFRCNTKKMKDNLDYWWDYFKKKL